MVGLPFSLQDTYCNLGWTLLAADVNGDSEPDLVIGSPFAPGGGKQKGLVAALYSGSSYSDQGRACWGGSEVGGDPHCSSLWCLLLHRDFGPIFLVVYGFT